MKDYKIPDKSREKEQWAHNKNLRNINTKKKDEKVDLERSDVDVGGKPEQCTVIKPNIRNAEREIITRVQF